ncbi:MAG TPA: contractile injection system tape measure protein, partial [Longimicrobium sp.]
REAVGGRAVSPADDAHATLLHYLGTGTLPWSAAHAPPEAAAAALRAAVREGWRRAGDALRAAGEPAAAWFRLLHLLDAAQAAAFVEAFAAHLPPAWRRALLQLLAGDGDAARLIPRPDARLRIAAALVARGDAISLLRTPSSPPDDGGGTASTDAEWRQSLLSITLRSLGGDADDAAAFADLVSTLDPSSAGEGGTKRTARRARTASADRTGGKMEIRDDAAEGHAPTARHHAGGDGDAEPAALAISPRPMREDAEGDAFPIPVANAGLVLLNPFIPMLFQRLGVAEDGAVAGARLPRAAALLHHLAAGRAELHEFELGMVKVLLGLRPADALPVAEGLLEPGDAEEAEGLLESVVAHWNVLKNTSPEGLRGSFLRRPGLLRALDRGWGLQVEPAPWDVLLDHLPWSVSVVKFPWMAHPVHVEWKTTR